MTAIEPMADVTFGGDVNTVLQSARTTPPPATLEEARNQPGRRERIEEITAPHRVPRASSTSSSSRSPSPAA